MAESRFCVGFSSACKHARKGGGLPASEGGLSAEGNILPPRVFLPQDLVRLIDALVRRLQREDRLLAMNGGRLGCTLCEASAAGGLLDVRFLLSRGVDVDSDTIYEGIDRVMYTRCALEWSVFGNHLAVAAELVSAGAGEMSINSALVTAADHGRTAAAAFLLDRGADVRANKDRALRVAARHGVLELVTLLLDRGANVHNKSARWNAHIYQHPKTTQLFKLRGELGEPEAEEQDEVEEEWDEEDWSDEEDEEADGLALALIN